MDLLRAAFSFFWIIITILLTGFVFWRKLRLERVDFEDKIIDRALVSILLGVLGGRMVYVLLHFSNFGWDMIKWLSLGTIPGIVDLISLLLGLLVFYLMLGKDWKDPIEVMDYLAIAVAFFHFLVSLGDLVLQGITYAVLGMQNNAVSLPLSQSKYLLASAGFTVFYLILFFLLSRLEKNYRTFLWYRAKRRSAQTGFVFASFLMGYGLLGITLGWLQTSAVVIAGLGLDPVLKLLVGLGGIVLLYVRSGRRLN